ncbi:pseudouridine synthase deg1 [Coemansia sp. RSA 552]|nr:pseudouridine synthase deg1 [Coemansia sp. RSA 552]
MDKPDDYESWSKEELVARLRSLDSTTSSSGGAGGSPAATPRKHKRVRRGDFAFDQFPQRKVAFKFSYFGWPYYGLARQGNVLEPGEKQGIEEKYPTVEGALFRALAHCRLISSEAECDYSRCGRTDRGVSGFGQVVSLYVRSAGKFITDEEAEAAEKDRATSGRVTRDAMNDGQAVLLPEDTRELPYVSMLNKILPSEIRILAWSPVAADFDARFSCKSRFYRYFFTEEGLDIGLMKDAAGRLLGTHDFRNFCRLDPSKQIKNFERTVLSIEINPVPTRVSFVANAENPAARWWQLELRGTAFLWHQVRCMMAILFTVGQGLEKPGIIDQMTDVQSMVGKPEYTMASDLPLVLADCSFDEKDVRWIYVRSGERELGAMAVLDRSILKSWGELNTRAVMASALLQNLRDTKVPGYGTDGTLEPWASSRVRVTEAERQKTTLMLEGGGETRCVRRYVPIAQRKRMGPVDERNQAWLERKGRADKRARVDAGDST